ncbi:MAG: hypothetical protein H7330_16030 [Hymenobacteraceae bacterium]|nr:hypothetical protein [Hymenobacteraceae bacterium]
MFALVFVGPLREPIRNVRVVTFGLWACAGILPLALIAGSIRGIPFYWQLLDCAFAVGGVALLGPCRVLIWELENGLIPTH